MPRNNAKCSVCLSKVKERVKRGQAKRPISTGPLNALLRLHARPINLVVYEGPSGIPSFGVGFVLICLQRLSHPDIANQLCR